MQTDIVPDCGVQEFVNDKDYLTSDIRQMLLTGKVRVRVRELLHSVNIVLTSP